MLAYIVRRVIVGVIMLIVMSFVTYFLFFASPIDPGRFACGKSCPPELIKQTDKALGFNKAWPVQWKDFAVGVFQGRDFPEDKSLRDSAPQLVSHCPAPCLGYSVVNLQNVSTELKDKIPVSASVAMVAFLLWIIGGISLGTIAALTKGSFIDRGVVGTSLVFYAFPTFWIGLFLIEFPAIKWGLVSVPSYTPIADGGVMSWLGNLFLPGLTLALFYMASYVRITRAFVLESMTEDYLRTAKAKGVPKLRVLLKHTMRAALTPVVTMAGLDLASVLGGAVITEQVFNFNGLGKLAVDSTVTFDLPTVVGLVLLLATFVIIANIVVDILYAFIDPRVRIG